MRPEKIDNSSAQLRSMLDGCTPEEVVPHEFRPGPEHLPVGASGDKRAAILVLGVRSGTSCLARLLNALGATVPAQLVGPGFGNLFGHWEPAQLMQINEEILAAIGRSWHDTRPILRSWFRSKEAYAFNERIRSAILSGYGDAPLILIKEPRICRLAPLYLDVLDALKIQPLVILPIRHPWEMIQSIHERDHIDALTIELLWLRYLLEAEEASRVCKRVWISFNQLLADWQVTAQWIADRLGIEWPNTPESIAGEGENIVRPRHRHYQIEDDPPRSIVGPVTIRAWQAAQHALNGDEATARALFDEIRTFMTELDRLNWPMQQQIEIRLTGAARQLSETERRLSEAQRRLGEAEEWQSETEQQLGIAQTALGKLERLLAKSSAASDDANGRCDRFTQQLQERELQISQLRMELVGRADEIAELNGRIDSIHASICWRLTWPIRWLHRLANRARSHHQRHSNP